VWELVSDREWLSFSWESLGGPRKDETRAVARFLFQPRQSGKPRVWRLGCLKCSYGHGDLSVMFRWVELLYWVSFSAFDTTWRQLLAMIDFLWLGSVQCLVLASDSWHPSTRSPVVDEERMRPGHWDQCFEWFDTDGWVIRRTSDNECHTLYVYLVGQTFIPLTLPLTGSGIQWQILH